MSDLYLIWKNLVRRKLRLGLTLFAIVVAFLIFGVLQTFNVAFNKAGGESAANRMMTVNKINFTQPLPLAYVEKIRGVEGVKDASWQEWFGGFYKDQRNQFVAFGVDPESYLQVNDAIQLTEAERTAFLNNRQGAIIGEQLARTQGWKLGDRLPIQSNIYVRRDNGSRTWEVDVEGIFKVPKESGDSNNLYFHYKYFNEARAFNNDSIGLVVFTMTDPERADEIADRVDALFANSRAETQTQTEQAFSKAFIAQLGNVAMILVSVVLAAFFTILLIVGNTMILAIRERTMEIAVLKTLGFTASRVFRLVLGESLLLSMLGGLLGLGLATLVIGAIRDPLAGFVPNLSMDPLVQVQALLLMFGLGLVTGAWPAIQAMRLNTVAALARR